MEAIFNDRCERICRAPLAILDIVCKVTNVEDNALDRGCDVEGGTVSCTGPKPIVMDGKCVFSCGARCDIPDITNEQAPELAAAAQSRVRQVISEAFEIPVE